MNQRSISILRDVFDEAATTASTNAPPTAANAITTVPGDRNPASTDARRDCALHRRVRVLLCCTGSVASIKVPALARGLQQRGADVVVVPSASALHFLRAAAESDGVVGHPDEGLARVWDKRDILSDLGVVRNDGDALMERETCDSGDKKTCSKSVNLCSSNEGVASVSGADCVSEAPVPIVKLCNLQTDIVKSNHNSYNSVVHKTLTEAIAAPTDTPQCVACTRTILRACRGYQAQGKPTDPILVSSVDLPGRSSSVAAAPNDFCSWCSVQRLYPELPVIGDALEWRCWQGRGDPVLHVLLRRWADAMVVAPLSANTLAKMACGMCDNLLTCAVRAWDMRKPLLFCPAMNTAMYEHPLTARHIDTLKEFGYLEVAAVSKRLECGDVGSGAMAEVRTVLDAVWGALPRATLV